MNVWLRSATGQAGETVYNSSMSPDEQLVFLASAVGGVYLLGRWYFELFRIPIPVGGLSSRLMLAGAPLLCLGVLFSLLIRFAAHDVRDSSFYLLFYLLLGVCWLFLMVLVLPVVNLCIRDDAVERGNLAAAWSGAGAMLGLTLAFAGANIGDGPGWWVVLFSAALSTVVWLVAWALWEGLTGARHAVTLERDGASGLRSAAMAVGLGLLAGRSVAGDWVSASATVNDCLRDLWPLVALLLLGGAVERILLPRSVAERYPLAIYGWGPAICYLGGAVVGLLFLGWWT